VSTAGVAHLVFRASHTDIVHIGASNCASATAQSNYNIDTLCNNHEATMKTCSK